MDETELSRYWCHMCSQTMTPILNIEAMQCPICQSDFIEEISSEENENIANNTLDPLSLWAPILLGLMGNTRRRRRIQRLQSDSRDLDNETVEFDRELESIFRRRRRNSATILRLLRDMRSGLLSSESGNEETDENEGNRDDDRERVILINPFNQTIVIQNNESLGDYFVGPGLDLLLQHLSENDPNRYGTPPAKKEAVEGLLNVRTEEVVQCSVCLDECEVGVEVKEMPCKHKFHEECLLPWLKLHSSCPMCRYQLPFDEGKMNDGDDRNESGRQLLPWGLLSSGSASGSRLDAGDSIGDSNGGDGDDV